MREGVDVLPPEQNEDQPVPEIQMEQFRGVFT